MEQAALLAPERFVFDLLFASLRIGALLAMLPGMGGVLIPVRVRIGLAGAVGLLLLGTSAAPRAPADMLAFSAYLAIAGELLIGGICGLALHAAFAAAQVAGEWLSQAMGLGFATLVDPVNGSSTVLSALFALLAWALFLGAGGHLVLIEAVAASYRAMPTAATLFEAGRLWAIVGWAGFAIGSGLIAALPLASAMLLINLALAVAARSAPQLNLFSIGFPLMLLAGIAGLPLALPALSASLLGAMSAMQQQLEAVLLG